jgi:hypothetical protein
MDHCIFSFVLCFMSFDFILKHQLTSQGAPIILIPTLTQNILTIGGLLIGIAAFTLGLRIQNATRTTTGSSITPSTLPPSIMKKYSDLLILALIIRAVFTTSYGIVVVGSHLSPEDFSFLLLLFPLFIPVGAVLFLLIKLRRL